MCVYYFKLTKYGIISRNTTIIKQEQYPFLYIIEQRKFKFKKPFNIWYTISKSILIIFSYKVESIRSKETYAPFALWSPASSNL
jgi:predicted transcriptional regulator